MLRKIIKINEELCNGCGLCVNACHESAIGLVDGKAKLLRDDYCDGLGNCLPVCPTNAINFEEREALEYNEEEVNQNILKNKIQKQAAESQQSQRSEGHQHATPGGDHQHAGHGGCPGSRVMDLAKQDTNASAKAENAIAPTEAAKVATPSMLRQWPVQIQLVPPNAPYFQNANLLIAAECTAYAFGDFHQFMKNKITLIGCPKLDEVDYSIKLTQILSMNQVKSITVIRMEVPCCGGIVHAVKTALMNSGQMIPWSVITIGTDGTILEEN
jgi:ferredoxin